MLDNTAWTIILVILNVIWLAMFTIAGVYTWATINTQLEYNRKFRDVKRREAEVKLREIELALHQMPPPNPVDVANNAINNWYDSKP